MLEKFNYNQVYIKFVDELEKYIKDNNLSKNHLDNINAIKLKMNNFKLYLPLIGNFNAGKSSIINAILGCEILPTDIRPETAIATEILYGSNTSIKLHNFDGTYEVSDSLEKIDTAIYKYAQLTFNNSFLKDNPDIILVDMPGLDSGLERHNNAIFQYIKFGVIFILVIDVEEGGLKRSTINFIKEISDYNLNVFVLLNKIDKKPEQDINDVKTNIEREISRLISKPIVGTVSSRNGNIEDFYKIVKQINYQEYFRTNFNSELLTIITTIENEVQILKNSLTVSDEAIDDTIDSLKNAKNKISKKIKIIDSDLSYKIEIEVTDNILRSAKTKLRENSEHLISMIKISTDSFISEVNEILRHELNLITSSELRLLYNEAISSIGAEITELNNSLFNLTSDNLVAIKLDEIELGEDKNSPSILGSKKMQNLYRTAAGTLGIATTVVAPWLELIIVFLPDIINIFSKLLSDSSDEYKNNKIKLNFESKIVPQIMFNLRSNVKTNLNTVKTELLNSIHDICDVKLNEIENSLENAKKQRENNFKKLSDQIHSYDEAINNINELKTNLLNT